MRLTLKVSSSSNGSIVLSQWIVQLDAGPLASCKFCRAQIAQYSGLGSLATGNNHSVAQAEIAN